MPGLRPIDDDDDDDEMTTVMVVLMTVMMMMMMMVMVATMMMREGHENQCYEKKGGHTIAGTPTASNRRASWRGRSHHQLILLLLSVCCPQTPHSPGLTGTFHARGARVMGQGCLQKGH